MNKFAEMLSGPLFETTTGQFRFAAPLFLAGIVLLPLVLWAIFYRERHKASTLRFATAALIRQAMGPGSGSRLPRLVGVMRILCLGLLVLAMARPQFGRVERQTYNEGIDIMLVLDVSLSMRTPDMVPNRLEAAKEVLKEFVANRIGDRIGLVIFGSEAATIIPMTLDYGVVRNFIERVQFNLVDGQTTAIGMGLATGLNKLKDSKAKTKIIILLTDGANNAGKIDPNTAAEAAKASKVRVYTIGVGGSGPVRTPFGIVADDGVDEKNLTRIANTTGGRFYRATDNASLASIYEQIDKLEKSKVEATQFDNFNELAPWLILGAVGMLLLELLLRSTRFLKVP
ncbi:MAG: VWA domain-containing protein [Candidatus Sumerlaeaceae bacterium]|nr:VWA domain-containing protein [Candidatus Sumerlaeaceae bacterium]